MTRPDAAHETAAIEVRNVCKGFGANKVLEDISLDIESGESFALIGRSGAGKSVILKCILGLMTPDSGTIKVEGRTPSLTSIAGGARIGMLFQAGALFDSMTVFRNVAFQLLRGPNRLPVEQAREIAAQKLQRVGLETSVLDLYPSELSGGMQKRASLARAIATDPDILFFDEPTTGLDPIRAASINRLINGIVQESGNTAITITHDMSSVRAIASRVAFLDSCRIAWTGPADELDQAEQPELRQFVSGLPDDSVE